MNKECIADNVKKIIEEKIILFKPMLTNDEFILLNKKWYNFYMDFRVERFFISKRPSKFASSFIYEVAYFLGLNLQQKDVSRILGISNKTLQRNHRLMKEFCVEKNIKIN